MECPICRSRRFKPVYDLPQGKIVECINCETVFRENLVSGDLAQRMYNDDDYLNSTYFDALKTGVKTNVEPYLVYNKVLQRLEGMVEAKARLLDVGCSYGAFIDTARQHGWDVYGVDIAKKACSYAANERQLNVYCGTVEEAQFPDEHFSVVTLWDVIEHLDRPLDTLNEVNRILAPGGLVVIFTINQKSLINVMGHVLYKMSFNTFRAPLVSLYAIYHNFFFCLPTLKGLLQRARLSEYVAVDWMDANLERWQTVSVPWHMAVGVKCLDIFSHVIGQPYRMIVYASKAA